MGEQNNKCAASNGESFQKAARWKCRCVGKREGECNRFSMMALKVMN